MTKVLFVTWDGPDSTYLESLFLPIFERLTTRDITFHVMQFTWATKKERLSLKRSCEVHGCTYESISIIRWPLSAGSLLTTVYGAKHIRRAINNLGIHILMARSTLPAMAAILALRAHPNVGLIFDADGLPHDERVDFGGMSSESITYRVLRDFESLAVRRAHAVLTRSKKAIDILISRGGSGVNPEKFYLVTNGRNPNIFRPLPQFDRLKTRSLLGINADAPLLVHVGSSLQGKYCGDEIFDFFQIVHQRRQDTRLLLLTNSPAEADYLLNKYEGLRSACDVLQLAPGSVPKYLAACDLGLVFIHRTFSMQAVAAIKLGEYLLCGLPVVASSGIGDINDVLDREVGYSLTRMSPEEMDNAAIWFLNTVLPGRDEFQRRARNCGLQNFSIESSADVYARSIKAVSGRAMRSEC